MVGGYEIVAKLRSGGMATLFLALKQGASGFRRHVAVKVVHEHLSSDPDFIRMFVDEALLQARIQNPHVVHVEELGEADGNHFLVMEYVHGCSLSQLLLALGKRKRRLTSELAVSIAMQVLQGLHAAHELRGDDGKPLGVVHRDVSPQNVLLSRDGHVKLIDFGVAKASGRVAQTTGASIKGKLRYMPPEQAFGGAIDRRADVYALGIVIWEMLTMRKLFHADNDLALLEQVRDPHVLAPSQAASGLSAELDAVVLKALAPKPEDRYASAQEFRRALGEALPRAAMVDPQSLAELIEAVLGEELERERRALPAAVSAAVGPAIAVEERADEIVLTMTVSSPGLLSGDSRGSGVGPISGSTGGGAETPPPVSSGGFVAAPPAPAISRTEPLPLAPASPPPVAASSGSKAVWAGLAGLLITLVLAVTGWALLAGRSDEVVATPLAPSATPPAPIVAPAPDPIVTPTADPPTEEVVVAPPAAPEVVVPPTPEPVAATSPRPTRPRPRRSDTPLHPHDRSVPISTEF